jgi:ketol-acid reductoisomerase
VEDSPPRFYHDEDADLSLLGERKVAVLGYGHQGRAQALNMRDSGVTELVIGNVDDEYGARARQEGFTVLCPRKAAELSDVLLVLLPDEVAPPVYEEHLAPRLREGTVLVFASGYNLTYGYIRPPEFVDVVMVAPRMLGQGMRDLYLKRRGFVAFVSVEQDASGQAWPLTLAVAKALGATRAGVMELSARQETVLDLFMEQAFGPVLGAALTTAFKVGVEAGLPPEALVLELYASGEMAYVFQAMAVLGLMGQTRLHSPTSQFGGMIRSMAVNREEIERSMREALNDIVSGAFAREWEEEREAGYPAFALLQEMSEGEHPMSLAEKRLRGEIRLGSEDSMRWE